MCVCARVHVCVCVCAPECGALGWGVRGDMAGVSGVTAITLCDGGCSS